MDTKDEIQVQLSLQGTADKKIIFKKLCVVCQSSVGLLDYDKANKMSHIDPLKEEAMNFAEKDLENSG